MLTAEWQSKECSEVEAHHFRKSYRKEENRAFNGLLRESGRQG